MTHPRLCPWILLAVAFGLIAGVWQCASLMWSCDDAYITFRYAANFADGHGLIYNPGAPAERVEGYSNFSWTLLMSLGLWLGVGRDALWLWAAALGLVCHLATALVLLRASLRTASCTGAGRALPVAAIALGFHHYWASLAVCGLETALFTLLVTCLAVGVMGRPSRSRCAVLGVVAALACWTRPDGALPSLSVGMVLVFDAWRARGGGWGDRWGRVLTYGMAAALLLVPHLLWRHAYYGAWVPNTAVAKSASEPYLTRGWAYVSLYFAVYWGAALGGLGLLAGLFGRGRSSATDAAAPASPSPVRAAAVGLAVSVPYLGFVLWVGGDFMFSRFLLPITPLLYLGFETALPHARCLWCDVGRVATAVAGTVLVFPPDWLDDYRNPHGFSDNRAISLAPLDAANPDGPSRLEAYLSAGQMMRELTEGLDVRVALHGSHANLAYTGRFPVAIETAAGLTDAHIAALAVKRRGMVGHEKHFSDFRGYLEERGVLVNFHLDWRGGNPLDQVVSADGWPLRAIQFVHPDHPGVMLPAVLVTYRKAVLDEIARRSPGCRFVRFDEWLDREYLPTLGSQPRARVRRQLAAMDRFYFDHNPDPVRRQPIAARAAGR